MIKTGGHRVFGASHKPYGKNWISRQKGTALSSLPPRKPKVGKPALRRLMKNAAYASSAYWPAQPSIHTPLHAPLLGSQATCNISHRISHSESPRGNWEDKPLIRPKICETRPLSPEREVTPPPAACRRRQCHVQASLPAPPSRGSCAAATAAAVLPVETQAHASAPSQTDGGDGHPTAGQKAGSSTGARRLGLTLSRRSERSTEAERSAEAAAPRSAPPASPRTSPRARRTPLARGTTPGSSRAAPSTGPLGP